MKNYSTTKTGPGRQHKDGTKKSHILSRVFVIPSPLFLRLWKRVNDAQAN